MKQKYLETLSRLRKTFISIARDNIKQIMFVQFTKR